MPGRHKTAAGELLINELNVNKDSGEIPLYQFWQPRFWPLWAGILILRLLVLLPYRLQMALGRRLGRLLCRIIPERQNIAAVNLRLCFPELDENQLQDAVREHFESLGMGIFELALSWWISDAAAMKLIRIDGVENVTEPLRAGRGVILVSGHFASIELTGRVLRLSFPSSAAMYRPMKNPMVDQIMRRARRSSADQLISKDDMRQMIRALREGLLVWYAPDQSYSRKYSVLVPFFNEPAMTNAALTHIARISKACVVLYVPRRLADGSGYYAEIKPALEDFPSDDPAADALRINKLLEEKIRLAPEQYYWIHRRFKDRPEPFPDPYAGPAAEHSN